MGHEPSAGAAHQGEGSVGCLDMAGRVLVFGGCYSNFEATEELLRTADRLGVPPERIVCTGDVVAYGADPRATVDLIRRSGIHVVMGNCEEALGHRQADCGCGFAEGSTCDRLSGAWFAHADAQLDEGACAWMRSLPHRLDVRIGGRRLAVVHGSVERINEFLFASTPVEILRRQIDLAGCDGVIAGHCGLPFTTVINGRLWHNAGAVGLPANDGTPRTWFSVLATDCGGLRIHHHPLEYDAAGAARKLRAAGLPEGDAAALETGFWPSCDVLPAEELARRGGRLDAGGLVWNRDDAATGVVWPPPASVARPKFTDPDVTATGARRAAVSLARLETLWFNTGTLCNLTCHNCYIESSPRNDRLSYFTRKEVRAFLAEATADYPDVAEIGFTGGEPFMNPDILGMIEDALTGGWTVLVLTNAMRPMQRMKDPLRTLAQRFPGKLTIRVSLDHHTREGHERFRGARTWQPTIDGLRWLAEHGFDVAVAGRTVWKESEAALRAGYDALFRTLGLPLNAHDPTRLVLFPEMDGAVDVPEITDACWGLLRKSPASVMCATSRMVIKRREAERPAVVACTLLPYGQAFEMGATLKEAARAVKLNHRHCAEFCVLGGASCSPHPTA